MQESGISIDTATAIVKTKLSLEGLSVGDAFGELFISVYPRFSSASELPAGPWAWTDDTHMAISIVETLKTFGRIDQDKLATLFSKRFIQQPYRGYARGAMWLLGKIAVGADWREISPTIFGTGSYGNGAAMRAAPIGGYFYRDPDRAAKEAQLSAVVTHAHPEGQAGAIAVAVAAAIAARDNPPLGQDFLQETMEFVPTSKTKEGIQRSIEFSPDRIDEAIRQLGTGYEVSAQDTVPFCLWTAAHHLDNYEEALWSTVVGMGDCDTTCAIVGGVVALSAREIPAEWLTRREALPDI